MKICRLCLRQDAGDLIHVLNTEDAVKKIKECVSVEITNKVDVPVTVCRSCVQKVEDWWNFKNLCLESDKVLLQRSQDKDNGSSEEWGDDDKRLLIVEDEQICRDDKFTPPETTYACDICSKRFTNCLDHLEHQSTHDGAPVFKCDKCEAVFSSRASLVDHDRSHKVACPTCAKMVLKNSLKLHLIKHTDRHMCARCGNRFNSDAALQQHVITIHTDRKDYICETCGKRFSSKTAMSVHSRTHSEERLYRCKVCSYAGRTASAVYIHMSTHANEALVCEPCSKTFKSGRNLYDHLRRVHCTEKKHGCQYCGKRFVDRYTLTVHARSHTGVRPYACALCDKTFVRSDALKDHMGTHSKRLLYTCGDCGRKFICRKGAAKHDCTTTTARYRFCV